MKVCAACGEEKDESNYRVYHKGKYLDKTCRTCRRNKSRPYREINKDALEEKARRYRETDSYRFSRRKSTLGQYGISVEVYELMAMFQQHVCMICGNKETKTYRGQPTKLCVDHDHNTGEVRGLLCSRCNAAIGLFQENTDTMRSAVDYLEKV